MAKVLDALKAYNAKRDFKTTAEPSGAPGKAVKPGGNIFMVQKHAATRLHYDLRLEYDGVFKSWAVTKGPSLDPHDRRLAVEVEDHPLDYGDFEGTIPKGEYGGGTVMLWDRGYWAPEGDLPIERQLAKGHLTAVFEGRRMKGAERFTGPLPRKAGRRRLRPRRRWAGSSAPGGRRPDRPPAS